MPFIPPMLATRLEDPRRLADPRDATEPKLDGQRAQLHVRARRTVRAFSRPGREDVEGEEVAWVLPTASLSSSLREQLSLGPRRIMPCENFGHFREPSC